MSNLLIINDVFNSRLQAVPLLLSLSNVTQKNNWEEKKGRAYRLALARAFFLARTFFLSRALLHHSRQTKGTACSLNSIGQNSFSINWMSPTAVLRSGIEWYDVNRTRSLPKSARSKRRFTDKDPSSRQTNKGTKTHLMKYLSSMMMRWFHRFHLQEMECRSRCYRRLLLGRLYLKWRRSNHKFSSHTRYYVIKSMKETQR